MCLLLVLVVAGCGSGSRALPGTGSNRAVPGAFEPDAFAALDGTRYWLLGTVPCHAGRCTAVVRTVDGGRTFTRTGAPPVRVEGYVPELFFADGRHGFAFVPGPNGKLFATPTVVRPGGASNSRTSLPSPPAAGPPTP